MLTLGNRFLQKVLDAGKIAAALRAVRTLIRSSLGSFQSSISETIDSTHTAWRAANSPRFLRSSRVGTSRRDSSGIALILVIFVIGLATTIVVSVTYSTYIAGRLNASLEQGLKGEYLVKSALSFARVLIKADTSDYDDPAKDPWYPFRFGQAVPADLLGIQEPNVQIELEISPTGAKMPIQCITDRPAGNPDRWLDTFAQLFQSLGFDDPPFAEPEPSGHFEGKVFKSNDLVANLLDYIDRDSDSLNIGPYQGVESDVTGIFKNVDINRESELSSIPGFTPRRVQELLKHLSVYNACFINFNAVGEKVFLSLDRQLIPDDFANVKLRREDPNQPPMTSYNELKAAMGGKTVLDPIQTYLKSGSKQFTVIAKVQTAASVTYLRALLRVVGYSGKDPPDIESIQLF